MAASNTCVAGFLGLGLALIGPVPPALGQAIDPAFVALVERYGRGSHVPAVAELSAWSDEDLERFVLAVANLQNRPGLRDFERFARTGDEGRSGPRVLAPVFLRAAVMLHADADEWEHARATQDREHVRACSGPKTAIAARYAAMLPRTEGGVDRDFVRGFFLAMAEISKYDACFTHAERWARDGLKLFPRDARLLSTLGGIIEADATLRPDRTLAIPSVNATQQSASRDEAANQRFRFNEARRAYEEALAADMDQAAVRVRLGRVLWRLGERDEAAAALARAIDDARDAPRIRYLAHLFLGRVQEDGGRLDEAESSYRRALELDPQAQAAGIALAHVLRLAGDEQAAREVAVRTVSYAGRRGGLDFFWEYLTGSVTPEKLLGDLRAKVRR